MHQTQNRRTIFFLTLGTRGDLYPFLGIARELRARGHEVVFFGSEAHREICEAEGCKFEIVQTAKEHRRFLRNPDVWKPVTGLKLFLRDVSLQTAVRSFSAIENAMKRFGGPHRCALVSNNALVGGLLAREKLRLPTATVFLHPYSHVSPSDPAKDSPVNNFFLKLMGKAGRKIFYTAFEAYLNFILNPIQDFRALIGLGPARNILGHARHDAELILDLWPDWFCPPKEEWPSRAMRAGFVDYDGPQTTENKNWQDRLQLRDFLKRNPIVFTMGSEMIQDFRKQVKLFSQACAAARRPGLFVSAGLKDVERLNVNENFIVIKSAPFRELFASASAVVTHGGIGTVARALQAGKPMVVTPLAFDQFDNAFHVERIGAGSSVPYRSLTPQRLAEVLGHLRATAGQVMGASFDGASVAADAIERYLLNHKIEAAVQRAS